MSKRVKFFDISRIARRYGEEYLDAAERVILSGRYIRGDEVRAFEQEFAEYCGVDHCVGVGNGLDALTLMLRAEIDSGRLKAGDEVLVPANTFIATFLAVTSNGLTAVPVEPDPATFNMDPADAGQLVTERTRGMLLVHLYGRIAICPELMEVAADNELLLWEDAAQAHGAMWDFQRAGSFGRAAGFSFYPAKNLGSIGDAGAVLTDDAELARHVRVLANYGSEEKYVNDCKGVNSRLDEIQAAFLRVRLRHLEQEIQSRTSVAHRYLDGIANTRLALPEPGDPGEHVWHLFVIRCDSRETLQAHLDRCGIDTLIHYPIPPHKQGAYTELAGTELPLTERIHETVISLPVDPFMTDEEVDRVVAACNAYHG